MFGAPAMTPTLPTIEKGAATTREATAAIMYPPLAATTSTHAVRLTPAARSRISCAAARP